MSIAVFDPDKTIQLVKPLSNVSKFNNSFEFCFFDREVQTAIFNSDKLPTEIRKFTTINLAHQGYIRKCENKFLENFQYFIQLTLF